MGSHPHLGLPEPSGMLCTQVLPHPPGWGHHAASHQSPPLVTSLSRSPRTSALQPHSPTSGDCLS